MPDILIKRVYDAREPSDGFRVLVDHLEVAVLLERARAGRLTLLFASRDIVCNQAAVLRVYLLDRLRSSK